MAAHIIITTINEPTEAVRAFAGFDQYRTLVVGDRQTPDNWSCENVRYLSTDEQLSLPYRLSRKLPWNHYSRKMLGYLCAMSYDAPMIIDTDDDNIPKPNWGFPAFNGSFDTVIGTGYYNVYAQFTDTFVWPRGFPLNRLHDAKKTVVREKNTLEVGIWQFLADEDPDVDAIYRLICKDPVRFSDRAPIVLDYGLVSPFNSQNTAFRNDTFPLLYLPVTVSFRFTDILRSLVAQPILWMQGLRVGFGGPTVIQKRNHHDLMEDFASEIPMYCTASKVVDIVKGVISKKNSLNANLSCSYKALAANRIVQESELDVLQCWIEDLESM